MPSPVHVVAHFAVKTHCIEQFISTAERVLVEPTQTEPGCIRYELCQDLGDESRFAMLETWETEAALDRHLAQPSLSKALDQLGPLIAGAPQVHRLGAAS